MSATGRKACYYPDYLRLDLLLAAQQPESAATGRPAHDEMLFIVVHQAYELWFRLVLHELDRIQSDLDAATLDDRHLLRIDAGLGRIHEIWKLLIQQVDVLETMTPLDFLDFRDLLVPASGFQSRQFREIEARMGLPPGDRPTVGGQAVGLRLSHEDQAALDGVQGERSLAAQLEAWLARMPFLSDGTYSFREAYREAVEASLATDRAHILATADLTDEQRRRETEGLDRALARFGALFEPGAAGQWRMAPAAVEAALFIMVHRDEPVLQLPFRLLGRLIHIDEALTLWRYRHALMVRRMLGVKTGTGGSSGHDYLREGAERLKLFPDLVQLSSYLIPRSKLPPLPDGLRRRLGFAYATEGGS